MTTSDTDVRCPLCERLVDPSGITEYGMCKMCFEELLNDAALAGFEEAAEYGFEADVVEQQAHAELHEHGVPTDIWLHGIPTTGDCDSEDLVVSWFAEVNDATEIDDMYGMHEIIDDGEGDIFIERVDGSND